MTIFMSNRRVKTVSILRQALLLFSHYIMPDSLWPHGLQHTSLPCPPLSPGACSNSCPLSQWRHPTISSSVDPSPPALSLFQWVSPLHQVAKRLELQLQHQSFQWIFKVDFLKDELVWSPWESKGLSRVLSNTTVWKHQFFDTQPSSWSNSHIHTWLLEKP